MRRRSKSAALLWYSRMMRVSRVMSFVSASYQKYTESGSGSATRCPRPPACSSCSPRFPIFWAVVRSRIEGQKWGRVPGLFWFGWGSRSFRWSGIFGILRVGFGILGVWGWRRWESRGLWSCGSRRVSGFLGRVIEGGVYNCICVYVCLWVLLKSRVYMHRISLLGICTYLCFIGRN